MKIAILTSRFPYPPDRGDRHTVFHLIRGLSARHRVTLISFTDGHEPPDAASQLSRYCSRIETVPLPRWRSWVQAWAGLVSPTPSQVCYYQTPAMGSRVACVLSSDSYDVVFNHMIRMAPFTAVVPHPAKILWLGDSLGLHLERAIPFESWWKRPGLAWEMQRVNRFQARISRHFAQVWTVSSPDREHLIRNGCRNVRVVPIGVDERLFDLQRVLPQDPRIVYVANFAPQYNVDAAQHAARHVWPHVHRVLPNARLVLAGANPGPQVAKLGEIPGVEVTGPVPDMLDVYRSAHVLLAAMRYSTGVQNKVMEAMAAGVPVVTTPQVAEGIDARHGEHLLAATTAEDLAQAVLESLRDSEGASARARRAREHVRQRFPRGGLVAQLEALAGAPREQAAAS